MPTLGDGKHVLLIVGDFVEDYEVMVPFQALEAFGFKVDAVCPGKKAGDICRTAIHDFMGDQTYSEKPGHNFVLNATYSEAKEEKYDAIMIPGGRSAEYLSIDESVLDLVRAFAKAGKPIASICHGQLILASAGVLSGKKATAYPACKPSVVASGAIWQVPDPITLSVEDDLLVTAAAWPGHPEFLRSFLRVMKAKVENNNKRVLMLCGDFMEDYEAMVPYQALLAVGYRVDAVCPGKKEEEACKTAVHDFEGDQTYTEKPGHNFALSYDFEAVNVSDYDALLVPGGRAPEYLSINEAVLDLVRKFDASGKLIASICHGQQILAAANILKEKKCTAYPAVKPSVVAAGAEWLEPAPITRCFTDGHLVTGAAWPAHPEFIAQILAALGTTITL
eukprot:TRINITY_DN13662_c0_g1_i1.p1 TRINITY_DN13662_c0_g1~~TRINITY_DN13662_c0_g1_i1.p1  ORF type:complete len:392 (-),score=75.44 TRINITY_DN13662_c0_g1_i1:402-1577(-)